MSRYKFEVREAEPPKAEFRQAIWDAIKALAGHDLTGTFKLADVEMEAVAVRTTCYTYLKALVAGGYLSRTGTTDPVYKILRDAGHHAPRLKNDGTPATAGGAIANMWRSMRMLKQFDVLTIAAHSATETISVTEETAKSYCHHLLATGYLRVVQKAAPSQARRAVYRLIRDDGPRAPMIRQVKEVYDPNTGKAYRKAET